VVTGWLSHLEPTDPQQRWAPSGPRSISALARRGTGIVPDAGPGGKQPDREQPDGARQNKQQNKRQPRKGNPQ
jgi:hypothetical protein